MSIEQTNVVDFITEDHQTGDYWLSISDHLDWDEDVNEHLLLLQEKINTYLSFIQSGEFADGYPEAKHKRIVINIGFKYPLPEEALKFIELARTMIESAEIGLRTEYPLSN